jgi:hypothetical protein
MLALQRENMTDTNEYKTAPANVRARWGQENHTLTVTIDDERIPVRATMVHAAVTVTQRGGT